MCILLRRPASPDAFSGNIIFEIMNATPRYDLDRCWTILRRQILRDGDIYVGVLSKPVVFDNMRRLDPERYQDLKWPNPLKYDIPADKLQGSLQHLGEVTFDSFIVKKALFF